VTVCKLAISLVFSGTSSAFGISMYHCCCDVWSL